MENPAAEMQVNSAGKLRETWRTHKPRFLLRLLVSYKFKTQSFQVLEAHLTPSVECMCGVDRVRVCGVCVYVCKRCCVRCVYGVCV